MKNLVLRSVFINSMSTHSTCGGVISNTFGIICENYIVYTIPIDNGMVCRKFCALNKAYSLNFRPISLQEERNWYHGESGLLNTYEKLFVSSLPESDENSFIIYGVKLSTDLSCFDDFRENDPNLEITFIENYKGNTILKLRCEGNIPFHIFRLILAYNGISYDQEAVNSVKKEIDNSFGK